MSDHLMKEVERLRQCLSDISGLEASYVDASETEDDMTGFARIASYAIRIAKAGLVGGDSSPVRKTRFSRRGDQ